MSACSVVPGSLSLKLHRSNGRPADANGIADLPRPEIKSSMSLNQEERRGFMLRRLVPSRVLWCACASGINESW